jgi:hypothetical protein
VQWEAGVNRGDPGHKVFLESYDGAFRSVASVAVRWHQLVSDIIDFEETLQSGGCLVVESLELWLETLDSELLMNGVICFNPLRSGPRFHGDDFNVVAIINITDHHVRVSFAGLHRELSRQVRVKLTLIDYDGVHEVGLCAQVSVRCWLFLNGRLWFIWPMAVAGVSLKCLLIASSVKPGQVIRCRSLTACNIADFVGLNNALCK